MIKQCLKKSIVVSIRWENKKKITIKHEFRVYSPTGMGVASAHALICSDKPY